MLPGRRRLQQGRRDTQSSSTPGAPTPSRAGRPGTGASNVAARSVEMPPYKPQSCPLTDEAISQLFALSQALNTAKIDEHARESLRFLAHSTSSLNETLQVSSLRVEGMPEATEARREEKARLAREVGELRATTERMTREADAATRALVDLKAAVVDEREGIRAAHEKAALERRQRVAEKRRRRAEREERERARAEALESGELQEGEEGANPSVGEDGKDGLVEGDDEEVTPLSSMIAEVKEQKSTEYESMTLHQRYATNNDYIAFKRAWHVGLRGEDAILPDAKKWFSQDGQPVYDYGRRRSAAGRNGGDEEMEDADDANNEEDEDLVLERETLSTRCLLSLQEMTEPYTSSRCPHTFEKTAIMEFLGNERKQCPQTGCNMMLTKNDLYLDQAMLARIRRMKQEPHDEDDDDDDEEEDEETAPVEYGEEMDGEEDQDDDPDESIAVKSERAGRRASRRAA